MSIADRRLNSDGNPQSAISLSWRIGQGNPQFCWLSLDEGDNDPTRFLVYLIRALQTIAAHIGEGMLGVLQSPQPTPTESILTALLNEITAIPHNFVLVLDDYHVIEAKPVANALAFLLEHLPPQMHLVIATREDPPLPLARYRARGQLTELRAADLRFTSTEAARFLNQVMGLQLSSEDIAALETRTEGWIAGLQLAALALQGTISIQGHQDTAGFLTSFTGSHHFVMDYLVEEVLHQQPDRIQTFLLRTSILNRLCGPLCDAVLPDPTASGQEILEYLERANLLVVPLDDKREWYRYHHLFADVLQARLLKEQSNQVTGLHLRACAWFEQNNFRAEAIHHALAARDFEHAADLIELERSAKLGTYFRSATWLGWVKALPDKVVRTRPRLSIGYAWELLFIGELEAAETRLGDTDRSLARTEEIQHSPSGTSSTGRAEVTEEEFRSMQASIAIARAFHAQALGDAAGTVLHARRALTFIPESDYYDRGLASALLGLACWTCGDLETAYKYMAGGMASMRRAGNLLFATSGTYVLAEISMAQGRLFDAARIYQESLQLLITQGEPALQGAADLYLGLSGLYLEWGNLEAARQHMAKSEELGERGALPDWPYALCLAQAQMKGNQGDLDGALELLDKAERLQYRTPIPSVRPLAALKAQMWIRRGRLTEALGWVHSRDLSVHDDLSYLREFEHVTLARVLIAGYNSSRAKRSLDEAVGLLERLLTAAEEGGRMGSVIEILMLQALAHKAQGNIPLALGLLERALTLAEPEGYVRIFVDEGEPMRLLILDFRLRIENQLSERGQALIAYADKLVSAFARSTAIPQSTIDNRPVLADRPGQSAISNLVEPLSQRELEILQLIAQGLSNIEISKRLFLALPTVKGYNRNIFDKLQVQRRTEAVARAHELGLL